MSNSRIALLAASVGLLVLLVGTILPHPQPEAPIQVLAVHQEPAPVPAPRVAEAPAPAVPTVVEDLDDDGIPDDRDEEVLLPDGTFCVPTASLPPGALSMHVSSSAAGFDQRTTMVGTVHGSQTCYKMSFPDIPLPDGGKLTP